MRRARPTVYTRYVEHWEIPDPARMSLDEARKVRDEIKRRVIDLIERIKRGEVPPAQKRRFRLKLG